jgi:hypothetical protein
MKPSATCLALGLILFSGFNMASAANASPLAQWSFEDPTTALARDSVSNRDDTISGFAKRTPGVHGQALWLDGYTTAVIQPAAQAPHLSGSATFEAWIALEAYPWGLCAIVNQADQPDVPVINQEGMAPTLTPEKDPSAGYFFGLDANGRLNLQLSLDGKWVTCRAERKIPLLRWTHVAGVYDATAHCVVLYLDGREVGRGPASGQLKLAPAVDLLVGRNHKPRPPEHPIRLNIPALYGIEGLLDEVKIFDHALSGAEIAQVFGEVTPPADTGLKFAHLPEVASGTGRFGAYSTQLKYNETWDALRREGPASDVIVRFDEHPWQFIFWRGTNYIPHWVTENGIWYTNEFNETWGNGALGCAEPMSDKQARHSRVQIIEATDARVVVHWRYALVDTRYVFPLQDPLTGWGDWSDEYHIIYPDGTGVRKIQLWSSRPLDPHEFQESIVLIPAGSRPEDVIETDALTMANLRGEAHTYSWAEHAPDHLLQPAQANIEIINTKSKAKPFLIVSDEPFELYGQAHASPAFRPFNMEVKRENSIFPWWNHWPVAQIPSDGRWATEPDRMAHSSLSTGLEWKNWEVTPNSRTRIMLQGLTEKSPAEVARLGRSWLRAPAIANSGNTSLHARYDQSERAYIIEREAAAADGKIEFTLPASEEQPLVNPAFICKAWPAAGAELRVNGKSIPPGRDLRVGIRHALESDDLIVWLKLDSSESTRVQITPSGNKQ